MADATQDINECERYHGCQHVCNNTEGSYVCSCPDGFQINYDQRTCRGNLQNLLSDPFVACSYLHL